VKKSDINKPAETLYKKTRKNLAEYPHRVLKQVSNKKLAGKGGLPVIQKGRFKGYVVHTLTLEERATCPRHCHHWDTCYGNNMPFAHRLEHGPELEQRIAEEIEELCATYRGVIVRLHVLGDFYSVPYVMLWDQLLSDHDNLAVWGYTAHHHAHGIGLLIKTVRDKHGERWSVRFSGNVVELFSANSLDVEKPVPGVSFACPEQTGDTKSCATCALCWSAPDRRVLFATH